MTKHVTVRYFAVLKDRSGIASEEIDTTATSVLELYDERSAMYSFDLNANLVRWAINGEFASADTELKHGDEVVFIPPVAGG